MKLFRWLVVGALMSGSALIACGSDSTVVGADDENESGEAVTSELGLLRGGWEGTSFMLKGLDLRPNGKFFYDRELVRNGFPTNGGTWTPHFQRATGSYKISTKKKTITFTYDTSNEKEVYAYLYSPPRPFNGMPTRNGGPLPAAWRAKLELKESAANQFGALSGATFAKAASYCATVDDCNVERTDKTWETFQPNGTVTCNPQRLCELN